MFLLVSVFVSLFAFILPVDYSTLSFRKFASEYGARLFSTIGNPPFLAAYLLLSIFIGLILIVNTHKTYLKVVCFISIGFSAVIIYLTASRGAILAGTAGIILSMLLIIRRKKITFKKYGTHIIIIAFIAVSVISLAFYYSDILKHDRIITRFGNVFSDPSVKSRVDLWEMALNGIKERPVLGWGQGNVVGIYSVNPIPLAEPHIWMDRAHNIIIEWLVSAGFLGLFAYLAIFIAAIFSIRSACNKQAIKEVEASVLIIALLVYFIQNLFIFDTINTYIIFFSLLAYIDNLEDSEKPFYSKPNIDTNTQTLIIKSVSATLLALMFCSFTLYYLNYKPIKQSQLSARISNSFSEYESISMLLEDINNAMSISTFVNLDLRSKMNAVSNSILIAGLINKPGAVAFIKATTEQTMKGIKGNRHDLEYLSEVVSLFHRIAQFEPSFIDETVALIRECMRINPEYQWPYFVMTDIYILKEDYNSAYANAEKIMGVDPQNEKKLLKFALAAIYLSREDVVKTTLDKVKKIRMANNSSIASGKKTVFSLYELKQLAYGYKGANNYQKALQYFKEIINLLSTKERWHDPLEKAQIHIEIAKIYQALGESEKAAIEAEKATLPGPLNYEEEGG